MVVPVAQHDIEHGTAGQREEHHEFEDGKTAAFLLGGRLWMAFLVFLGVGQLSGGGLNDFHRTAIELAAGGDRAVAPKAFSSRSRGSRCRACTQAESPSSMESSTVEAEQSLDMADDLAAGGFGGEHLPKETFEGPAQAKDPVAAVRSLLGRRKQ